MIAEFDQLHPINQVPFAAIMRRVGTRPVLLDFLLPSIDLVIWQMPPCVRDAVDIELRQSALRALGQVVEASDSGVAIYEFDGFSFFAFRSVDRDQVLAEMGITELLSC